MVKVHCLNSPVGYASNCYILESDGEYAIIDPSISYDLFASSFGEVINEIKYIIVTHAHFDHILEIDSWTQKLGLPITVGEGDANALCDADKNCYRLFFGVNKGYCGEVKTVKNSDLLPLGQTNIEVIATPGHTVGGISLSFDCGLIVGDTVFADGGYGRCDLPGGCIETLYSSISYLLERFDDFTPVFPGHGRSTSIDEIKNYF